MCDKEIGLLETRYSTDITDLRKSTPNQVSNNGKTYTTVLLKEQAIVLDICKDCFKTLGKTKEI